MGVELNKLAREKSELLETTLAVDGIDTEEVSAPTRLCVVEKEGFLRRGEPRYLGSVVLFPRNPFLIFLHDVLQDIYFDGSARPQRRDASTKHVYCFIVYCAALLGAV